jgi:hypothetical protein
MKTKSFLRKITATMVTVAAILPGVMLAYDFKEGNIYYDISGSEATVTRQSESAASYTGDVVIPTSVVHDGVEYAVTAIGNSAFYGCHGLTSVEIPNTIVRIGDHAFRSCGQLQSVIIPNSVTYLGRCSFHSCTGLKSVVIGDAVQVVDEYAFQYCSRLTDVVLGQSVNMLKIKTFYDCYSLTNITCLAPEPPAMYAWYSFDETNYNVATVHVQGSSIEAYKADELWGQFRNFVSLTKATGLTLDKALVSLNAGEQVRLQPTFEPADASSALQWTSSNANVAQVDNSGLVTAMGAGETVIKATALDGTGLTAQCVVRVYSSSVQGDNVLTMPATIDTESGKTCRVPVAMRNVAGISAMQCDIVLPEGIELAQADGNYLIETNDDRMATSHNLIVRKLANGAVRLLITSPVAEAFNGNEGELFVLSLNVAPGTSNGAYAVALVNVVMADVNALTYHAPDVSTQLIVDTKMKGDANGDGMVNVGDYVTIANYILELNPQPFFFSAADVDGNEEVNVGDLVGVTNIMMGIEDEPADDPVNPDDDAVMLSGSTSSDGLQSTVTIDMSNTVPLTAMQMDVTIPDGMMLNSARLSGRGSSSHALKTVDLGNGRVRLLASSSINDVLGGTDGSLVEIVLDGTPAIHSTMSVDNIVAAEQDMTLHAAKAFKVGSDNSSVKEFGSAVRIYAQDGNVVVETPADAQVELIAPNGMTRVVTAKSGLNTYPAERGICIVRVAGQVAKLRL